MTSGQSKVATRLRQYFLRTGLGLILLQAGMTAESAAFDLVTQQEASLPDDPSGTFRGGPTRGPDIVVKSPVTSGSLVRSPMALRIIFQAHGGAKIDRDSVLFTYKKLPPIDITQRIAAFIRDDGVTIEGAELPPGVHRFQIDVSDTDGRKATQILIVNIEKQSIK